MMYATNTKRRLIKAYKLYDFLRPENFSRTEDPFYLGFNTVNKNPNMNQTWFLRAPVVKNKLANFIQSMVKSAD